MRGVWSHRSAGRRLGYLWGARGLFIRVVLFFFGGDVLTTIAFAGNNYSITNESRTKNARIFFAQGCEVEPEMASQ